LEVGGKSIRKSLVTTTAFSGVHASPDKDHRPGSERIHPRNIVLVLLPGRQTLVGQLKLCVGAVAERSVAGMLAAAEINRAVFFGGICFGRKPGSFVRAVAQGLAFALATGTPVVGFSSFNGQWIWRFLCNFWLVHNFDFSPSLNSSTIPDIIGLERKSGVNTSPVVDHGKRIS